MQRYKHCSHEMNSQELLYPVHQIPLLELYNNSTIATTKTAVTLLTGKSLIIGINGPETMIISEFLKTQ